MEGMYYSYVMGIDESIKTLEQQGFSINNDGGNYKVAFPKERSHIWEDFISGHLELGYWNEYLTEFGVVFLFHLDDGIRRYVVYDYNNDEVLHLCEKLCECHFDSLYQMLAGNHYYREMIGS